MRIKQESKYEGDDWWDWSVELDAPREELEKIKHVEYTLHPTFRKPVRRITDESSNFKLSTSGWGVFPIYANVVYKDGTEKTLEHDLELYYPSGEKNLK